MYTIIGNRMSCNCRFRNELRRANIGCEREGTVQPVKNHDCLVLLDGVQAKNPDDAVPGVLCVSLPWAKNMESLMHRLNRELICISRFSACTSSVTGPSRILLEMGVPKERDAASLRISLGRWSKRQDFFRLAEALESVYKSER